MDAPLELTPEELNNFRVNGNYVLVEITHHVADDRTKSGIYIVNDMSEIRANSIESGEAVDLSAHLDRFGTVVKVPSTLAFSGEGKLDPNKMEWKTMVETEIGDTVWFDYRNGYYSQRFKCEGRDLRLIPYSALIVAKKSDTIKPLNGYVICTRINEGLKSKYLILEEKINTQRGIVKYVGKPNKAYANPKNPIIKEGAINVGDTVTFSQNFEVLLENVLHLHLDNDKEELRCIQDRYIVGVYGKEDNN